jgi:hypothetical protein
MLLAESKSTRSRKCVMPTVVKPLYELAQGALGATNVYLSPVPDGKSRVISLLDSYHTIVAGSLVTYTLYDTGGRAAVIQTSLQGPFHYLANPGTVPSNTNYPFIARKFFMGPGQYIGVAGNVGVGERITLLCFYYEWYHDYEPVPWQVFLL